MIIKGVYKMETRQKKIIDICYEVYEKFGPVKNTLENNYFGLHSFDPGQKVYNGYKLLYGVFDDIKEYVLDKNDNEIDYNVIVGIIEIHSKISIILRDNSIIYCRDSEGGNEYWITIDKTNGKVSSDRLYPNSLALNIVVLIVVSGLNAILSIFTDDIITPNKAYEYILDKMSDINIGYDGDKNNTEVNILKYLGSVMKNIIDTENE